MPNSEWVFERGKTFSVQMRAMYSYIAISSSRGQSSSTIGGSHNPGVDWQRYALRRSRRYYRVWSYIYSTYYRDSSRPTHQPNCTTRFKRCSMYMFTSYPQWLPYVRPSVGFLSVTRPFPGNRIVETFHARVKAKVRAIDGINELLQGNGHGNVPTKVAEWQ